MSGASAPAPWVLTLDIGSSSIRAVARDARGRILPGMIAGKAAAPLQAGADGSAVFSPAQVLQACDSAIDQALASLGQEACHIGAVAIDSFGSSLVAVDDHGSALTEVLCYADTRGSAQANHWRRTLDEPAEHDRTGTRLHASYWPAQLAFLLAEQPGLRSARFWPIGTWLMCQWFGPKASSGSLSAMAWTGLLDRKSLTYDTVWLDRLNLREEQLPRLSDFARAEQGLTREYASRWPALAGVPWFLPIVDGAAANVGGGAYRPGSLAITLGTTCAMRVVPDHEPATLPFGLWQYRVDRSRPLVGGALTEGGGVFDWACRLTGILPGPELETALKDRKPGAGGLVMVPLLAGERAPGWNDAARGTLGGISLATTGIDLVASAIEGVACRLARLFALMEGVSGKNPRVIASGGLLASEAWRRALANALGVAVYPCLESEATGRGMALLALAALGHSCDWEPELGRKIEPDSQRHADYVDLMNMQRDLEASQPRN